MRYMKRVEFICIWLGIHGIHVRMYSKNMSLWICGSYPNLVLNIENEEYFK